MGKLGKKARKFAKKNLQSVLKQRRKTKAFFKKRSSSKNEQDTVEDRVEDTAEISKTRNLESEETKDVSLDAIFSEDDTNVDEDVSESDGFLSEDSSCSDIAESGSESILEGSSKSSTLLAQNGKIHDELATQQNKLDRLKKKDPEFAKFLESYNGGAVAFRTEDRLSDEDEMSNHGVQSVDEDGFVIKKRKLLTNSAVNSWCQLVMMEDRESVLTNLLNGYRAACHYGSESLSIHGAGSCHGIQNSETFCNILMFMLREADNIFRGLLKISPSGCRKGTILELKNTSKWKTLRPLLKSYLRSTLFLLNEVTDSGILVFSLTRLSASIIFFAAFPSLLRRLVKIAVHLWATGRGALSSCSFLIIRDAAVVFTSEFFDICLIKMYKSYIAHCKFMEPINIEHIQYLRNSLVEVCSLDLQRSCGKALVSIQQLAKILQQGLQTKKEAVKKICSWQYVNCIDLWVMFISANIHDCDLQPLFYTTVQLINGVACLFTGPRYFPLRLRCIQWLNHLSNTSGIFIPVASLILDILEYNIGKEAGKPGKAINFSSTVKLPKFWLKSRDFQEERVLASIELLVVHFAQWSYHISFPELATIPLIRLRKFHEVTSIESLRRVVKRLIDQVELNVEFVQKKREEVAFSPKDHQSVELFLQLESTLKTAFAQYYKSIMEKAASRNLDRNGIMSSTEKKISKR
ncbi:protein REBELOTE [Cornus florida]|uniref:protein REBELOTE n=1 Tax=Cornus florida TaxID=4283 RepID=UPI0028A083E8|nr:protein REBELOTE [Cornus florida]